MSYKNLVIKLIDLVGGEENIADVIHCHTRLRFTLKNRELVKDEEIAALDGIMTTRMTPNQYQVIIGDHVKDVYDEFVKHIDVSMLSKTVEKEPTGVKKNIFVTFAETMSAVFTPLIIAICGSGLMTGVQILLLKTGVLTETSTYYTLLGVLGNVTFYFLPFMVAVSAAERFKANKYMAMALVGVLMYPTWTAIAATGVETLQLFGFIPIRLLSYSSSVIPPLMTVYVLSKVQKVLEKVVPGSLSTVLIPFIELFVLGPIIIALIGPVSQFMSDWLANGYLWLYNSASIPASLLFGGLYPIIVLTGTHLSFVPIMLESIALTGVDYIMPLMSISHCALAGSALAVYIKTKNSKLKSVAATGALVTGIGLTEPALYGVALPLKKPLIISVITGAIGGAFYGLFKVSAIALGLSPLGSIPIYFTNTFVYFAVGGIATAALAFVATWIWGYKVGDESILPGYRE